MRKSLISVLFFALTLLVAGPILANNAVNATGGYTLAGAPLALRGYDPVAYFEEGKAVEGQASLQAVHAGATYQFSSEANQQAFEANPERFAPQFGGFCAFGVALGKKFDGDPQAWKIVDGKLYLNLNGDIQQKWQEDEAGNIQKAVAAWPTIEEQAPAVVNR